jgi:hypothetical protein
VSVSEHELALLFTSESASEILRGREGEFFLFQRNKKKVASKKKIKKINSFFLSQMKKRVKFLVFFGANCCEVKSGLKSQPQRV